MIDRWERIRKKRIRNLKPQTGMRCMRRHEAQTLIDGRGVDGRMKDGMIDRRITWIRMKGWIEGNKLTGERGKWSNREEEG